MEKLINKTVAAVEQKLWPNKDGCYIDLQQEQKHTGAIQNTHSRRDLYLIANVEEIRRVESSVNEANGGSNNKRVKKLARIE